jgi:protein TonB
VVLETRVDTSSGYDILDQAAVAAVRAWRFVPARLGGAAIEAWVRVPVAFRLTDR